MPLRRLVEFDLPRQNLSHRTITFSADGSDLLLGTNSFEGPTEKLGLQWVSWSAPSPRLHAVEFPAQPFVADLDGSVLGIDLGGGRTFAVTGSYSIYRNTEEQLWLLEKDAAPVRWLHHARSGAITLSVSPDRTQLCFVNAQREPPALELVAMDSLASARVLPLAESKGLEAIAVSAQRGHVALAYEHRIACTLLSGEEVCVWPKGARVHALHFAEDDLALWAIRKDEIMLLQWKGEQVAFGVPQLRPIGINVEDRTAMFLGAREVCELDLSTGARRATGDLGSAHLNLACDPKRRRIATLEYVDGAARIRIFELSK